MSKPMNAALGLVRLPQKVGRTRKNTPDWLGRPVGRRVVRVRSVQIIHGKVPHAGIQFTDNTWWGIGGRTPGELLQDVADIVERETGLLWRKGPR